MSVRSTTPGELVLLEKGDTGDATAYYATYRYNPRVEDWLLVKTVEYESMKSGAGWEPPRIDLAYHDGVLRLDGSRIEKAQAATEAASERRTRLAGELAELHDRLTALHRAQKLATLPPSTSEDTWLAELVHNVPVTQETVEAYNNIGYFLLLAGNSVARCAGLYLLEKVVQARPDRTPAYLNLADGYFEMGSSERARAAYSRYVALMKDAGRTSKIPKRAIDRAR